MYQDYDVEQEKVRIEWAESNSNKNLNPDSNQNCGSTFRVISKAKKKKVQTYIPGGTNKLLGASTPPDDGIFFAWFLCALQSRKQAAELTLEL